MIHRLLLTEGKWFDLIATGKKIFDIRKGHRPIEIDDEVEFAEADEHGSPTGRMLLVKVTLVIHSEDFPDHFGWDGGVFTIFQFEGQETMGETAEELATAHWAWFARWVTEIEVRDKEHFIELMRMCYEDAFAHGYKHGKQETRKS